MLLNGILQTVDQEGRILLPEEMRQLLGIQPGDTVDLYCFDNGIFVRTLLKPDVKQADL